ncbi:4774_t:CDS:2, partial [Dentiscutata erythropus]
MPNPIWSHFIQLGRVAGFKQKRRECKYCQQQFNDTLRAAYENNSDSNISLNTFEISTPVTSNFALPLS